MRISEKTFELNLSAQINTLARQRIIWFGLTQRQEARLGFDMCTQVGGRLLIFQIKASNKFVRKARRFYTSHRQLQNLINLVRNYKRSVFYVFPMIGTTQDLITKRGNIVSDTWLLDVANLPDPFPQPLTRNGTIRRNGLHYIDVIPPSATIHSEPVKTNLISMTEFFSSGTLGADGINSLFENDFNRFDEFRLGLGRNSLAAIVLPHV